MAAPQVADSATSSEEAANVSSHTLQLPTSVSSGDLLVAIFSCDGAETVTWPSEGTVWIQLSNESQGTENTLSIAYKIADGTEGGTTIEVATGTTERSTHCSYAISFHDSSTNAPEIVTGSTGTNSSPNSLSITPTGGSADYLYISAMGSDRDQTVDAFPSNMTVGSVQLNVNGGGANSSSVGADTHETTASTSFDPNAFTISASDGWVAQTVAVYPGAEGGEPPAQNLDNITGFANAQAFGTHTINAGISELDLDGGGIASVTAFGNPDVAPGTVFLDLDTAGIASTTAFGADYTISIQFQPGDVTFFGSGGSNIGGAISTEITSGSLNNLWDDVSGADASGGDTEYRCIYVRNDHPSKKIQNVFVATTTDPAESDIAIGLGAAGLNGTETAVANEDTAPGGVSFGTTDVSIGDLSAGDHYGLWVRRTVTAGAGAASPDTSVLSLRFDDPDP